MTKDRLILSELALGKASSYASAYSPDLLQAVPRQLGREPLNIHQMQPFVGADVWHGYELSWLNQKGKPVVALMRCTVPATTSNIIESKSFKLYLNSLNQTRFESISYVKRLLMTDVSKVVGGEPVTIELFQPDDTRSLQANKLPGECIDDIDIDIDIENYQLGSADLVTEEMVVSDTALHSHLLKSNCLITNQPDWASVIIKYSGKQINKESLLRYLVSFRQHNEFHEQCVERIFMDITRNCQPNSLSVQALYTRRGGLDICPFRSSNSSSVAPENRINRQ